MFKELNIMRVFFEEPSREFGVRETAKLLDVAPATASKDLAELAENGFLKVREERRTILYSANIDSDAYRDLKVFHTIRNLKDKGMIASINRFYSSPTIILFGSAAKGEDKETSDLNLLIVSDNTEIFPEKDHFEKVLGRKLQIFVTKNFPDLKNKEIFQSASNGKIIQGEVRWEK